MIPSYRRYPTLAEMYDAPTRIDAGLTAHVLSVDELYLRYIRGEYHPLSTYIDFRTLVWTLIMNKDQTEIWHLIDYMLDPSMTDQYLTLINCQISNFMNVLLERYVKPIPTQRDEQVRPLLVTEANLYLVTVPYD